MEPMKSTPSKVEPDQGRRIGEPKAERAFSSAEFGRATRLYLIRHSGMRPGRTCDERKTARIRPTDIRNTQLTTPDELSGKALQTLEVTKGMAAVRLDHFKDRTAPRPDAGG